MDSSDTHNNPFVATFDNLAAAAFFNIAIKREPNNSPNSPQWFDSVPCYVRYPITKLRVPDTAGPSHAKELCDRIKARGNDYYKHGDHWEALWKYEHALFISRSYPELKDDAAALHSNTAAVCLKLGLDARLDLLDPTRFPPTTALWFIFTQQHASEAINLNPPPNIQCKAYFRRGESFKELLKIPELQQSIDAMSRFMPVGGATARSDSYVQVICDFLNCVERQEFPDPKIFCEIVMLAVDHGHLRLLPPLLEFHVRSHLPTQILQELLKRGDAQTSHLQYLLLRQEIQSNYEPHFDGSKISAETLLTNRLGDVAVFEKLYQCGMKISREDFALAKQLHQKKAVDKKVYEFILNKQQDSPEEQFFKLKQEGNALFSQGSYEQALGYYYKALNYCRKHNMKPEVMAVVRANCAQACLKLQQYRDAYTHADQCLMLNPKSHKGYFRRAEALKAMLDSSQKPKRAPGTYADIVKDYLESHALLANVETFCLAVTLTIDKDLNRSLIPRLIEKDVKSGFSDKVLLFLLTLDNITDKHLNFILFQWPKEIAKPFSALQVKILEVAKRSRSPRVFDQLFHLGMKVTDSLLPSIIHLLTNDGMDALEIILMRLSAQDSATLLESLNRGFEQAVADRKFDLAIRVMRYGAEPDRNELRTHVELRNHPFVKHYLSMHDEAVNVDVDGLDSPTAVAYLNKEARKYFKAGKYHQSIQLYHQALNVCDDVHEEEDLTHSKVALLANLSLAYIKDKNYTDAHKIATDCIKLDPNHSKAYFRRAEALKTLLDSSLRGRKGRVSKEVLEEYGRIVDDISRGNLIELNPKAFTDAIVVAVEFGEQSKLFHSDKVPKSFFTNVLNELVSRSDCEPRHLHYLVCTMWSLKEFSAAKVSLKRVLSEIGVTELATVQRLMELGMQVKEVDVSTAVDVLKADDSKQLQTFKYIASKCPPKSLDSLCSKAFKAKKIPFVFSFVEHGAKAPVEGSELLEHALKAEDYITGMDLIRAMSAKAISGIDLGEIMDTNLVKAPKLMKLLVESGANPSGLGRKSPLLCVLSMDHLPTEKKCEVACLLLASGADCNHLCRMKRGATTPLHVATEISLQAGGNTTLVTAVHQSPTFNPKKLTNDKQETPLHLTSKSHYKKEYNLAVLKALIELGIINPAKKDKSGKRAIDYLSKKDSRAKLLDAAAKSFKSGGAGKSKKKQKEELVLPPVPMEVAQSPEEPPLKKAVIVSQPIKIDYNSLNSQDKLKWQLDRLLQKDEEYFITISVSEDVTEEVVRVSRSRHPSRASPQRILPCEIVSQVETRQPQSAPKQLAPVSHEVVLESNTDEISSVFAELGFDLDNLPWEVEGTDRVVKFFKDVKRNSKTDRLCAARTIFALAEGKRNDHLSKPVSTHKNGPSLYEAKLTKAARLLWEKAITFSSKLTGLTNTPIYTQVIRIWDVVLDHDALERKIRACTDQILMSYKRGQDAAVKWTLQPEDVVTPGGVRGREMIEVPMRFLLQGADLQKADYEFVPAASTNKDEYNITTFVSFDTISFKSMLLGTNERRDYPFKEWQKEHEIIKLCSKEAILLLGRSGTGKTTCCLYRLWNEFKAFWNPLSPTHNCKLPRRVLVTPIIVQETDESDSEDSSSDTELCEDALKPSLPRQDSTKSVGSAKSGHSIEEYVCVPSRQTSIELNSQSSEGDVPIPPEQAGETVDSVDITPSTELVEEDLHQVFVTKNYVLCDQIKKRFFNMVAAHDFLDDHLKFENSSLPNSFSDIDNLAFPIFLTARQFYILLDNSLGDQDTFFRRDVDGNLAVKISSMDYDHEDAEILLDLEESDGEEEEDAQFAVGIQRVDQNVAKQHAERWTEVTALYFKEQVWPTISHQCQITRKDFDPLLVWIEIQSFIKGSERALRKGSPLNYLEYLDLGNKMAPNFSDARETIYKLFQKYQLYLQKFRHREFLFDECDLMHHLYKRLQKIKDVSWSFHSIYIDEVQDFTQAELAILIHCCRDPNSMLFTGDTAQSIMRGIAFRFQDLRSVYHRIHQHTSLVQVPQKPLSLNINFRSHSGILKLAGSVIDLIREFFKTSIDHLPDDEGMFPGPIPVLVESCEVDELALLLSTNKRKASAIEFGAHQAIIVQSKESKDKLPDILKGAIVLTIFEAKGLEFDDVLLYNFFTDSLVDEKGWRVISSYLEMSCHKGKIVNTSKLPGSSSDPRSRTFDPKLHKSLNAELKYLYTAITRTKCNLWIYDSDPKMRHPIFDYWYKRELVKVVGAGSQSEIEGMYNLVFASNSTSEQWKAQGDNFRKKHLWDQARLCYERAGEENKYLVKEAQAYQLIQSARQQKPSLYLEAAILFLECDDLQHKTHYISAAAVCLRHARPSKLSQAALLYEKLGEQSKACQVYLKAKDLENFIKLKEARKEYSSIISTLLGKPFMKKRDALMKAREYEELGISLEQELSASKLSYSCAKFYAERKDRDTLVDVLQYMPEVDRRVRFLKEAKLYDRAFKEYEQSKQYSDAYRLAAAQGWFDKGQTFARTVRDHNKEAVFILQKAKSKYKHVLVNQNKSNKQYSTEQIVQEVGQDVISDLQYVKDKGKKQKSAISTYATLLLGMITADKSLCRLAWRTFKLLKHKIGELESFHQLQQLADESNQSVLEVCRLAKEVGKTFQNAKDIDNVVQQGLKFYDFQKVGQVYCFPRDQDIWMPDIVQKCQNEAEKRDVDGMHRLDVKKVRDCVSKHCTEYVYEWVNRFMLDSQLPINCDSFHLHKQLFKRNFVMLDREYSSEEVSSEALRKYIQSCLEYLDLRLILEKDVEGLISLLLVLFSPQVTRYLPHQFNEHHVNHMRRFTHTHSAFNTWINKYTLTPARDYPERVSMDQWLTSWRVCCLVSPDAKPLSTTLKELEDDITEKAKSRNFELPSGFVYKSRDNAFYHIFSMWLLSCSEIHLNGNMLWASRLAIYHFISEIASSQSVSISVVNMVDILSLHCTALLAILTHIQARQNRSSSLTVPMLYKSTIQLFDTMISYKGSKWKLLQACTQEVSSKSDKQLLRYFKDSCSMLIRSLDILLGTYNRATRFCVLKFALKTMLNNDATRHCLILTLTLFGNLIMLTPQQNMHAYHQKMLHIFSRIQEKQANMPEYIGHVMNAMQRPGFVNPREVFSVVEMLLHMKHGKTTLAKLVLKQAGRNSKVDFVLIHSQLPRSRLPPRLQHQQQQAAMQQPTPPMAPQFQQAQSPPTVSSVGSPFAQSHPPMASTEPINIGPDTKPLVGTQPTLPAVPPPMYPPQGGMFPGQPPQAWSNLFQYPDFQSVHALQNFYPAYPAEGAFGGPTGLPQQQPMGFPQPNPPFVQNYPSSAIHMGPETGGEGATSVGETSSGSVGAHVVASYSSDELRKLVSSNQFDSFDFSFDPEPNAAQNVEYSEEYKEADEYGGFEQSLGGLLSQEPSLPPVDPELVDPSIVTHEYCSACGESFASEEASEGKEEEVAAKARELHYAHVTSKAHSQKTLLCKRFFAITDSEESDLPYLKLSNQLRDLVLRCEDLKKFVDRENLHKLIDNIKENEEKNDKILDVIQERRTWREGIQKLNEMVSEMDRLLFRGETLYNELVKEVQTQHVKDTPRGDELDEGELKMLSGYEDEPDSSEGSDVKQMRSAAEKQASRQRKRERKERQGRGGGAGGGTRRK